MPIQPQCPEELAEALACAKGDIRLGGNSSKDLMAGPIAPAETEISTAALNRVLKYEPRDLTISVEAGIRVAELNCILAENRQMIPLDPPFSQTATIGGALAAATSGPRRRLYGTARDLVIGMKFATLEGKLVQSGGMVVKNVAGLDMAKLMIGSFGTLAAIAVANFKLAPIPPASRSFVWRFDSVEELTRARKSLLASSLQPAAIDVLNPEAARRIGRDGWLMLVQTAGNVAVIERYTREFAAAEPIEGEAEEALWRRVQDFTPEFLVENAEGATVRVSTTLSQLQEVLESLDSREAVARAASGVLYGYFPDWREAGEFVCRAAGLGWKAVVEYAPAAARTQMELWPNPGPDLDVMKSVKRLFDPDNRLNRGRLYGRI